MDKNCKPSSTRSPKNCSTNKKQRTTKGVWWNLENLDTEVNTPNSSHQRPIQVTKSPPRTGRPREDKRVRQPDEPKRKLEYPDSEKEKEKSPSRRRTDTTTNGGRQPSRDRGTTQTLTNCSSRQIRQTFLTTIFSWMKDSANYCSMIHKVLYNQIDQVYNVRRNMESDIQTIVMGRMPECNHLKSQEKP